MKFQRKPSTVEAFQWTGDENQTEDPEWICEAIRHRRVRIIDQGCPHVYLVVDTPHGLKIAERGDWIVRYWNGHITAMSQNQLYHLYEPVPDEEPAPTCEHVWSNDSKRGTSRCTKCGDLEIPF